MNIIQKYLGDHESYVHWSGVLTADPKELEKLTRRKYGLIKTDWEKQVSKHWNIKILEDEGKIIFYPKPNLVVDSGVNTSLNRLFATSGFPGAIVRMGVDNGASNPTAATDQSGANTKTLLAFDSTPAATSTKIITAVRTFSNSNVNFIMKRLFLSRHTADITNSTSADTAGTLYSCTNVFTIDFTSLSSWTLLFSATITGSGT